MWTMILFPYIACFFLPAKNSSVNPPLRFICFQIAMTFINSSNLKLDHLFSVGEALMMWIAIANVCNDNTPKKSDVQFKFDLFNSGCALNVNSPVLNFLWSSRNFERDSLFGWTLYYLVIGTLIFIIFNFSLLRRLAQQKLIGPNDGQM